MATSTTATTTTKTTAKKVNAEKVILEAELAQLLNDIVAFNEKKKAIEAILKQKKDRLEQIMPKNGFVTDSLTNPEKEIVAEWTHRTYVTLKKELIEANHPGVEITDADGNTTDIDFVSVVAKKKVVKKK